MRVFAFCVSLVWPLTKSLKFAELDLSLCRLKPASDLPLHKSPT